MISKATDHKATVLMNRRMNTERGVTNFGPVCSKVAGMFLHHLEGKHVVQDGSASLRGRRDEFLSDRRYRCQDRATHSRVVIWSSLINPAMDCARDERIDGENNRSSADCHPKPKMGPVSNRVAGFTECFAECNFDCGNVRVYRGGPGARPDFR